MKIISLEIKNFLKKGENIFLNLSESPLVIYDCDNFERSLVISYLIFFLKICNSRVTDEVLTNDIKIDVDDDVNADNIYGINTDLKLKGSILNENSNVMYDVNINMLYGKTSRSKNNTNFHKDGEDIKYIHMGSIFNFKEDSTLSQKIREIYLTLNHYHKNNIIKHMKEIFKIKCITLDKKLIYIQKNDDLVLEISLMGLGFQRTFASFVTIYCLINESISIKYLLIEDCDIYLCKSMIMKYYMIMKYLCDENDIKLILSTNNDYIICNTRNKILTLNIDDDHFDLSRYLNINNKYECLLLVEGSDEAGTNGFFTELRTIYPIMNKFHVVPGKKIDDHNILNILRMYYNIIIYVKDGEFLPHKKITIKNDDMIKNKDGIDLIYTDLLSIESYLILNYVLTGDRDDVIDKLSRYFRCAKNKKKYFSGLEQVMSSMKEVLEYGNMMWSKACEEILKSDPDYNLIISVIRGHSWVEMFKNECDFPSNTKEWIKNTDFRYFHREVKNLLNILINYIMRIYHRY